MSRRRLRRKSVKAKPRVDPLSALFDELAEGTQRPPVIPRHNVAITAVRGTRRVERLAYTRAQAAAALGMTPATFARRVLPLIDTVEMPWGKQLVPVDELERLLAERRRPARASGQATAVGRRPMLPDDVVRRIAVGYDAGKSLGQIARDLNANGVPTAHGGAQWWPSTVRVVLRGRAAARLAAQTDS
jgi:Recombinase